MTQGPLIQNVATGAPTPGQFQSFRPHPPVLLPPARELGSAPMDPQLRFQVACPHGTSLQPGRQRVEPTQNPSPSAWPSRPLPSGPIHLSFHPWGSKQGAKLVPSSARTRLHLLHPLLTPPQTLLFCLPFMDSFMTRIFKQLGYSLLCLSAV